ncbi:MAG TPA: MBL fold metallo-hydrolase [Syntrophales bacterium]|nr:MBL fold metallo-hydrolase [Syntrophales bacterium]HQN77860.1 MBL fold metallo-hydrolase [Syntrophales bacterium]HQQ27027.1 MBL fold metallo-hydrolase [Syntrophales bacterium]
MILEQIQVGHMAVFAYLIGDEQTGEAMLVDPAADVGRLLGEARKRGLQIRLIVNTHGHVDHIAGNADCRKETGAKIVIHELDADMLTSTPSIMLRMFNAKASPPADITVRDGDTVSAGGISLQVFHTPGHTPGGVCLYSPGFVLTGDTLFVESVGRTDFPGGSWEALRNSIVTRLLTLPEETVVLPGHNYGRVPRSTIGHEKRHNPFLR